MGGALFFDIAPNLTGYCAGDGSGVPTADAWRFPPCGDDFGRLAAHMEDWLRALISTHDPAAVGYESPIHPKPHDKTADCRRILGLGVVLELVVLRVNEERERDGRPPISCGEVDLRRIKRVTTGDQWAEKKRVAAAVDAAGIPLPATIELGRHDAADAAGGWVILLDEIDPAAASPWLARFTGSLL